MPLFSESVRDVDGHRVAISSDGRLLTSPAPEEYLFYFHTLIDAPGVVAANTFMSLLNPVGSGKTVAFFSIQISSFASGAAATPDSLVVDRITAASGGSLIAASSVNRLLSSWSNPVAQVRTSNPSVTKSGLTLFSWAPPLATGLGAGATSYSAPPSGQSFVCLPGEGIAFSTPEGNTNQVWSINMNWAEF